MSKDLQKEHNSVEINATDALQRKLKALDINPNTSYARILQALWPGKWVTKTEIIAANENQSDTPRRIRELRREFNFDIEQEGTGDSSRYRLISHQRSETRRRKYISKAERDRLVREFGLKCNICGQEFEAVEGNLQVDHRIPFDKLGPTTIQNSQLLCTTCNVMKKRICEFCKRENCDECAYAHPDQYGNRQIIILPEHLMAKCRDIASKQEVDISEVIQMCIEHFKLN